MAFGVFVAPFSRKHGRSESERLAPRHRKQPEIPTFNSWSQSSDAFRDDSRGLGGIVGYCPNSKLRTVRHPELTKDPIQVFLDSAFSEMQLVRNFLVLLGFTHEINNLPFPKAEVRVKRWFWQILRLSASRADSVPPPLWNSFPHRKQFRMLINGVVSII